MSIKRQIDEPSSSGVFPGSATGDAPGGSSSVHAPCEAATVPPAGIGDAATVTHVPVATETPRGTGMVRTIPGYEVLEELGRGGMGVVYKARQVKLGRLVALKMILGGKYASEHQLARFRAEGEAVARLQHPHIVQIFEVGEHEGRPFFSLEYVDGGSLDRKLGSTPLPAAAAARLVQMLARAMHAAHQAGIIHRDLKPANILLARGARSERRGVSDERPDGNTRSLNDFIPKITDFGLAKRLDAESAQTQSGAIMGTPSYMAPEQAGAGAAQIGPAADVYALGAILYECLTGRPPFRGATAMDTVQQVLTEEPVPPRRLNSRVPRDLETIALKSLQKEPAKRYTGAAALADDLQHFLNGEPIQARPVGRLERSWRWCRRNPALAGLCAAGVALLAGLIPYFHDRAERAFELASREIEAARQQTLTEEGIRLALNQARDSHKKLQQGLTKPGGVQEYLNQPARWEIQIKTARGDWQRARALADNAGQNLDLALGALLQEVKREIDLDQVDFQLARRLEKIRLDKATLVDGKFNHRGAAREYPRTFQEAGFTVELDVLEDMAERIRRSSIKDQLVAAVDDWAWLAHHFQEPQLCDRLLTVARLADPDPWRNRVRDRALWNKNTGVRELAENVLHDQSVLAGLSPQMFSLIYLLLPLGSEEAWLRRAQRLHPADFWINLYLGNVLTDNKPVEAAGFYRAAVAVRPNDPAAYFSLGNSLRAQKDNLAAVDAYKRGLVFAPDDADLWNNLGNALDDLNDLPAAVAAFEKALHIDPRYVKAWNNLGACLHHKKDARAAAEAYKKAVAIDPAYGVAWSNLGNALDDLNDLPGAMAACKKALDVDPKHANAWNNLGNCLKHKGDLSAAVAAYRKAAALDPTEAMPWHNIAKVLNKQKDLAGANEAYKKALAIDAKDADSWNDLGTNLRAQRDFPAALNAFKKALAIDPAHAHAWNNLGAVLSDQNDVPAAIEAYRKAVASNPRFAVAWRNLGSALDDLKVYPEAMAAYEKSLAANAKDPTTWNLLSITLRRQKRLAAATDAARQALRCDPEFPEALCSLGHALQDQGDFAPALEALEKGHYFGTKRGNWRFSSAAWVKKCRELHMLDQQLSRVLKGEACRPAERLRLAELCHDYKKAYDDAVQLYDAAFAAEPGLAEAGDKSYRFAAARVAVLAARHKNSGKDQERLRRQALAWLEAALTALTQSLQKNPIAIHDHLCEWQENDAFSGLRGQKGSAFLSEDERAAWRRLWARVATLVRRSRSGYTQTELSGRLTARHKEQAYPFQMTAGQSYQIDLSSVQLDAYLRLEDNNAKLVAENDDISPANRNSRIVFKPVKTNTFRIVATSFRQRGVGDYTLLIRAFAIASQDKAPAAPPLPSAHSHNDYQHKKPLHQALEHGFGSVEADIYLRNGALLVGHYPWDLRPERTLEGLYLDPLRKIAKQNGGRIHKQERPFWLLIDVKTEARSTYAALDKVLGGYADIISVVKNGKIEPKAVRVVISGNRAKAAMAAQEVRYAGIDGRAADLKSVEPAHLLPWLSDRWDALFRWRGEGPMPAEERAKLTEFTRKAHQHGRRVRFWATPESPAVWTELRAAGVDFINTDRLEALASWLRAQAKDEAKAKHTGP